MRPPVREGRILVKKEFFQCFIRRFGFAVTATMPTGKPILWQIVVSHGEGCYEISIK